MGGVFCSRGHIPFHLTGHEGQGLLEISNYAGGTFFSQGSGFSPRSNSWSSMEYVLRFGGLVKKCDKNLPGSSRG